MSRRRKGPWRIKGKTADKHWYTTIGHQTVNVADKSCSYDEVGLSMRLVESIYQLKAKRGERQLAPGTTSPTPESEVLSCLSTIPGQIQRLFGSLNPIPD